MIFATLVGQLDAEIHPRARIRGFDADRTPEAVFGGELAVALRNESAERDPRVRVVRIPSDALKQFGNGFTIVTTGLQRSCQRKKSSHAVGVNHQRGSGGGQRALRIACLHQHVGEFGVRPGAAIRHVHARGRRCLQLR